MIRNNHATGAGDVLLGATFRVQAIRNEFEDRGGPLTLRRRRFLRRFIPPFVSKKPVDGSTQIAIMIQKSVLDSAPALLKQRLERFFNPVEERDDNGLDFYGRNPWLGDRAFEVDFSALDNVFGRELERQEVPNKWSENDDDDSKRSTRRLGGRDSAAS